MISFGVFSDVHYAKNKAYGERYCDFSLNKLKVCIETLNERGISLAFSLGDMIDKSEDQSDDMENLGRVTELLASYDGCIYSVIGNHDLETMSKEKFIKTLDGRFDTPYYSFDVDGCHFIILDANYTQTGKEYDCGNYDWKDAWIPEGQKQWLIQDLKKCNKEQIIVCTHQNLDYRLWMGKIDPHIIQNAAEIRSILENAPNRITVLQGHYHHGYFQKINGVDYITLRAMCEGDSLNNNAYMIMQVQNDGSIHIEGFGRQESLFLK